MSTSPEERVPLDVIDVGQPAPQAGRPWIGVHFVCAGRYVRVFRNVEGSAYVARCPSCGRCARFRVAARGMAHRFFEVSC